MVTRSARQAPLLLAALVAFFLLVAGADRASSAADPGAAPRDDRSPAAEKQAARGPAFLEGIDRVRVPFGSKRKRQMAAYSRRHYGEREWRLVRHRQIVLHYALASSISAVANTFRDPPPDPVFGERPQVCTHFVIGPRRAVQTVSLRVRCRHTLGLNHVTIGIEHLGYSDREVMASRGTRLRSLSLVRRLRCLYGIPVRDVIGHSESLRSRYYRERVPSAKGKTSPDFSRKTMRAYRRKLAARGCPSRQSVAQGRSARFGPVGTGERRR